jgi:hypothetical protein
MKFIDDPSDAHARAAKNAPHGDGIQPGYGPPSTQASASAILADPRLSIARRMIADDQKISWPAAQANRTTTIAKSRNTPNKTNPTRPRGDAGEPERPGDQ